MVTTEELVNAILTIRTECSENKDCRTCRLRIQSNPMMCALQNHPPVYYQLAEVKENHSIFRS